MNTNCLAGIRCPKCGSEGPVIIEVPHQVVMGDEGAEDTGGDLHWDSDSYMQCVECEWEGTAKDFSEVEEN